jgi:hypothetical protein
MIRVHVPMETKLFSNIYKPVDIYLSFFSIYQDWMMFAKNPSRTNSYLTADIEFVDGSVETFHFPKSTELNHFDKYRYGERYRKIISEGILTSQKKFLWKDAARFSLRRLKATQYNKIPKRVYLKKHTFEIPEWRSQFILHSSRNKKYKSTIFYTHEVI